MVAASRPCGAARIDAGPPASSGVDPSGAPVASLSVVARILAQGSAPLAFCGDDPGTTRLLLRVGVGGGVGLPARLRNVLRGDLLLTIRCHRSDRRVPDRHTVGR